MRLNTLQLRPIMFFFVLIVLSACGIKGDLYLPESTQPESAAPSDESEDEPHQSAGLVGLP